MHNYLKRHPSPPTSWTIPELCAAYDLPIKQVNHAIIAIVELGGGYRLSDVAQAFATMHLPAPNIVDVSVDGTTNNPGRSDADGEVALDIQIAGAVNAYMTSAPAEIRMYWARDIGAAVAKAAADGCDVCSISWGADEAEWGLAAATAMETIAAQATAMGMVVFAAAGDNDSSDGGPTPANVDCPGSCPHVICCGGTSKPKGGEETVWNDNPGQTNGEGTGGGFSTLFVKQAWQIGIPAAPTGLGRMVPDVAANADPRTGYEIVLDGQVQIFGGTSAVAPFWAGMVAACGSKLGFITPDFYKNPRAFVDIVTGSNGAYDAQVGPDACTGMGVPVGVSIESVIDTGTV